MTPTAPDNEFVSDTTCGDSYGKGWKLMWANFGILLAIALIMFVIRAPADHLDDGYKILEEAMPPWLTLAVIAYAIFLVGPITMSCAWVSLKAARKEPLAIRDMFSVFERNYWPAVGAGLLKFFVVVLGFLLLIIPGLFLACRLAFVEYLIIDRKMGVGEAFSTSWSMTRGHGWTLFGMMLLAFVLFIAGIFALIVGVFVAVIWIGAAFAVLYHSVELKEGIPLDGGASVLPAGEEPDAAEPEAV